jgi:hypothetical protein
MPTIYLEGVDPRWLAGTPEEAKRANEILDRNWDIVKPHIIQAQKREVLLDCEAGTPESLPSSAGSDQPSST